MEGMARVVELRTPWPLADCRQRLASNVSPMQDSRTHVEIRRDRAILRAGGDPTVIRGSVTERSFSLLRTGTMRNSFTSEARGILVDGGDHTIFLGEIVAAGYREDAAPLIWYGSRFHRVALDAAR